MARHSNSSEDQGRCALLQTDTEDRGRWDLLVAPINRINPRTTPTSDVGLLQDPGMDLPRKVLGLRPAA